MRPGVALGLAAALAAIAVVAVAAHSLSVQHLPPAGRASPAALQLADAQGILDSDRDGLSDAQENYIYGTDPHKVSTSGSGIPDGWLVRFGFDPLDAGIAQHPAATPPASAIPPAYKGVWPSADTPTLYDIYAHGRPATWNESAQGPYDSGLDPRQWDSNGDGIPDGFLLRFGVDPLAKNVSLERLAGPDGLTVQEAFQHGTDPRKVDTDGDGIPDAEEIAGPRNFLSPDGARFAPTDPTRFDTNGAGVCDGYLRAHGLDPSLPESSYGDQDHDGASTKEEYQWSQQRFGAQACSTGKGLDPRAQSSGGLPIPDGWLLKYGFDPFDATVPGRVTEHAATDPGPHVQAAGNVSVPDDLALTVLDEYSYGRPATWNETRDGPWWGGTNPLLNDTDGDGLGDAWEIRGYVVCASADPLQPEPKCYVAHSNPTVTDTDGDGLDDGAEARGFDVPVPGKAGITRHSVTDAQRRDTDFDGIPDGDEIKGGYGLDPTRADSTSIIHPDGTVVQGDHLRDGERLNLLLARSALYASEPPVAYGPTYGDGKNPNSQLPVTKVFAGIRGEGEFANITTPATLDTHALSALVGPMGDMDGDGVPNILDPDIDGDGLDNGVELHPELYAQSVYGAGSFPRSATDPLNPDTDGDGLWDGWEVAHGVAGGSGYSMDPAKWDSGSGHCVTDTGPSPPSAPCSDGDKDPDGDSISWPFYQPGPTPHITKFFSFPNRKEQAAQTDPNKFSSDDDGLGDGWKAFWGAAYRDQNLGLYHPAVAAIGNSLPGLLLHHSAPPGSVSSVLLDAAYQRWVEVDASGAPEALPGEEPTGKTFHVVRPDVDNRLAQVKGTVRFTLQDAQRLGTNPYMASDPASTDGDGMPDWWEDFFGHPLPGMDSAKCQPQPGPDPLEPDAAKDADGDGLPNLAEYTHDVAPAFGAWTPPAAWTPAAPWQGGNPLCQDTDMGGILDGTEAGFQGLKVSDPADDNSQATDKDTDHDGVPDFRELTGTPPTDPNNPDSDGDGLLDGTNMGPYPLDDTAQGHLARLWLDLGIAYVRDANGEYTFLGEKGDGYSTNPFNPERAASDAPEGWLVAHGVSPLGSSPACQAYYAAYRPSWWQETVDGPWWGGVAPSGGTCGAPPVLAADADNDGLFDHDGNGEPFEDGWLANHANGFGPVDPSRYGWAGTPGNPDPTGDGLNATLRRIAAQAFFNPHVEGDRFRASDPSLGAPDRETPCISLPSSEFEGGGLDLEKGTERILVGQVLHHHPDGTCSGPVPGVTVEARMGSGNAPRQLFGAAFTDDQGIFRLPVNISVDHRAGPIPMGSVLRGATAGNVTWQASPASVVSGGSASLHVVTYATPTLNRQETVLNGVTVGASPHITFVQPFTADLVSGQELAVDLRAVDTGGTPLPNRPVTLTFGSGPDGVSLSLATDDAGQAATVFRVPASFLGPTVLVARSDSGPDGLGAAVTPFPMVVRAPPTLALDYQDGQPANGLGVADGGSVLPVSGHVTVRGQDVANTPVSVRVVGAGPDASASASTDAAGRFHVLVPLDPGVQPGQHVVVAAVEQGDESLAGQLNSFATLRGLTTWVQASSEPIRVGTPVTVHARLVEADGHTPVAGGQAHIAIGGLEADAQTDTSGVLNVTLPGSLAPHPALQILSFAGDGVHAPARNQTARDVSSPALLRLPDGEVARGGDARISLRLLDAASHPIANARVAVAWGQEQDRILLTDTDGGAVFERAGAADDPLGPVTVRAAYAGTPDGTLGASQATATWTVRALAELLLPTGNATAGLPVPPGLLRDAGTLRPIGNARITLQVQAAPGAPPAWSNATTDGFGHFQVLGAPPVTAEPHTVHLVALFDAPDRYPTVRSEGDLRVRSATTLDAQVPAAIVLGRETLVPVRATDARGLPVPSGAVQAFVADQLVGSGQMEEGTARVPVTIPTTVAAGPAVLRVAFVGSPTHAPSEALAPVRLLAPAALALEVHPATEGGTARVDVLATAAGAPLPFTRVTLEVQGQPGGLSALTDKQGRAEFLLPQANGTRLVSALLEAGPVLSPASASTILAPLVPETALQRGVAVGAWVAGVAAVLLAAGAAIAYRMRRHPLTSAFHRTRLILAASGPLEKQVLLAYRSLEDAAIAHGILEAPSNTPRLLEEAIAPTLPRALHANLDLLVSLFEVARYGRSPVRPLERDAALDALDNLVKGLNRMDPVWSARGGAA